MCLLHCRQRPVRKRRPAQNTDVVGNSPKKHKAEPATAPPEKRLESPKVAVDVPSIDASNNDALNTVDDISESGSRLMTI